MRTIAVALIVVVLVLCGACADAQPLPMRIVEPPPAQGMPPRSGTYAEPSVRGALPDFTVQPSRPLKRHKKKRR